MTALLVVLGALLGAPARYVVDKAVTARLSAGFPWGTLVVNLSGCLLLGLLSGAALPPGVLALLGTGFCGAYTTYSSFGYEAVSLVERAPRRAALTYVLVSVVAGVALAGVGYALTS